MLLYLYHEKWGDSGHSCRYISDCDRYTYQSQAPESNQNCSMMDFVVLANVIIETNRYNVKSCWNRSMSLKALSQGHEHHCGHCELSRYVQNLRTKEAFWIGGEASSRLQEQVHLAALVFVY